MAGAIGAAVMAFASAADAQPNVFAIDNVPDQLIRAFRGELDAWGERITTFAKRLFVFLAGIEITVAAARTYYAEGAGFDRFGSMVIERSLFIGFWWFVLSEGPNGVRALIGMFERAGQGASSSEVGPTAILERGLGVVIELLGVAFSEGILEGMALVLPLLFLALAFVYAAMEYVGAIVDAYVVATLGIVVLGLAGSRWTVGAAQNYLRAAVQAGVHLMVINVVAGVGLDAVMRIADVVPTTGRLSGVDAVQHMVSVVLYVLAGAIMFAYLLRRLPRTVSAIVTGWGSGDPGGSVLLASGSGAGALAVAGAQVATGAAAPAAVGAMSATRALASRARAARQGMKGDQSE